MALMDQIMSGAMANPDILLLGVAAGFVIAKVMNMRKNSMGMGGGF